MLQMKNKKLNVPIFATCVALLISSNVHAQSTFLLSLDGEGMPGNNVSDHPSISADGQFVVFESSASNLVQNDTNGARDVFVYDRQGLAITRVNVSTNGLESDGPSEAPRISANGKHVVFVSSASNLLAEASTAQNAIYMHNRETSTTVMVSVDSNGTHANNSSFSPVISSDGRYVAFTSYANNLVAGDSNNRADVFVHDRDPDNNGVFDEGNGVTTRVSVSTTGEAGNEDSDQPAISGDGRFVVFMSYATNLASGDQNNVRDVFLHDRQSGETTRISKTSSGSDANGPSSEPAISTNGRYIAYISEASNLVSGDDNEVIDVFLYDRETESLTLVSRSDTGELGYKDSLNPAVSSDGRYVAFSSYATNLVSDTASNRMAGARYTSFGYSARGIDAISAATNIVVDNDQGTEHVYMYDRVSGANQRISTSYFGTTGNASSFSADLSSDGQYVVFASEASNLVCDDSNSQQDIFLHDVSVTPSEFSCQTGETDTSGKDSGGGVFGPFLALLGCLFITRFLTRPRSSRR
jgi:Tol biopolymer transport system component